MRLREFKPRVVWEISPAHGFSTLVILHALAANDNNATLHSFDVLSHSLSHITPARFPALVPMWKFHHRRASSLLKEDDLSAGVYRLVTGLPPPDYLYLDSKHNLEMATFYTSRFLPAVQRLGRTQVSLHDVYNPMFWTDGSGKRDLRILPNWMPNLEGAMVLDWLAYGFQSDSCNLFTIAPSKIGNAPYHEAVLKVREESGRLQRTALIDPHQGNCPEPTIYFELNCSGSGNKELAP